MKLLTDIGINNKRVDCCCGLNVMRAVGDMDTGHFTLGDCLS